MEPLIEGQTEFLKDYQGAAKIPGEEKDVIADVVSQLTTQMRNGQPHLSYVLPAENSQSQKAVTFPFTSEIHAEDLEATISTTFVYQGELLDQEFRSEEQK